MRFLFILFFHITVFGQDSFSVRLLDNWRDTSIIKATENARFSDVWGFDYKADQYAVLGSTEGSHFFKIANDKLIEIDFHKGAFSSLLVEHRDYKKHKNYIYAVCDEGNSTLQIFDLQYLPDSIHKVYDNNEHFTICHNIYIDTLKDKLYACGANNQGMKILDLSNPVEPKLILDFINYNYIHDCFVVNDTAFLNAGIDGLQIYYFGGTVPKQLGALDFYQEQGYNHSGWLSQDRKKYCFVDETKGKKIKYCDLSNGIEEIRVSALFGTKDALDYVPHNVFLSYDYAFVSYYNEGFRVFDLKSAPIRELAHFDTFPIETKYRLNGAWGVYVFEKTELILISDRQYGLFLFHFPFHSIRKLNQESIATATPFINEKSLIIHQNEKSQEYSFNIYTASGKIVYENSLYSAWINIPLTLKQGLYIYTIYSKQEELIGSGKFVVL